MIYAFTDGDGYYQCDLPDGAELPAWAAGLTPCAVRPPTPQTPLDQLRTLESQYALTQRNLREFILLTVEALKVGTPVDLSVLPGVQVVAAVEAEAASLRAQM